MTATPSLPHCLPYAGTRPQLAGPPLAALPGHALIGRITLGRDAFLGAGSVIRADGHFVRAGESLHLGRGTTVHISHDRYPTLIGDRVSAGANTVLHACTIRDDCVIDDDCVILDGSVLATGCVLEPASVVFPRSELRGGWLYAGMPAQPLRELESGELAERQERLRARNETAARDWTLTSEPTRFDPCVFVADTALVAGSIVAGAECGIWYGCRLDARQGPITIGARSNVQDNSVLHAGSAGIRIGAETTIGHNVLLRHCEIGAGCLVGIGSRIAEGTRIDDDTFVAAGASTAPDQRLDGGFMWGGVPARKLLPLDADKRAMMQETIDVYCRYAREMRHMQDLAARAGRGAS